MFRSVGGHRLNVIAFGPGPRTLPQCPRAGRTHASVGNIQLLNTTSAPVPPFPAACTALRATTENEKHVIPVEPRGAVDTAL